MGHGHTTPVPAEFPQGRAKLQGELPLFGTGCAQRYIMPRAALLSNEEDNRPVGEAVAPGTHCD